MGQKVFDLAQQIFVPDTIKQLLDIQEQYFFFSKACTIIWETLCTCSTVE